MENFKFIANTSNFNKNIKERNVYEFDILSLIQYICLIDILRRNGIKKIVNQLYIEQGYRISIDDRNSEQDLKNFIFQYKFFSTISTDRSQHQSRYIISFDNNYKNVSSRIIDIVLNDMLKNDFDKYIDIHQNNKYDIAKYDTYYDHKSTCLTVCFDNCLEIFKSQYKSYIQDLHCTHDSIPFVTGDYLDILFNEYEDHLFKSELQIENTMSEHIVYTSDLEVTKQVLRNNQKIINNIIKNLNSEPDLKVFDSNKQKLMRLLTADEIKSEVKPKQRTKITL